MAREPWPPPSGLLPADLAEMTALISRRQREVEQLVAGDITHRTAVKPAGAVPADSTAGTEVSG